MNNIGKNIRKLRQKNGWSQGEAAQRLKISIPA
jgi:transcriptional regulator with XRE-family HTH domain